MDLSPRPVPAYTSCTLASVPIVKPIPRHPCPAIWYRTMWPGFVTPRHIQSHPISMSSWSPQATRNSLDDCAKRGFCFYKPSGSTNSVQKRQKDIITTGLKSEGANLIKTKKDVEASLELEPRVRSSGLAAFSSSPRLFLDITSAANYSHGSCVGINASQSHLLDIATCDGPVHFERVSNPNFALTVQHCCTSDSSKDDKSSGLRHDASESEPALKAKTYTCIYCHQSFKSLFCYQKHKKRHINPVSVDLTGSAVNSENNQAGTRSGSCRPQTAKYLNVQFFPCKICGCKFPSYYFVHKHIKLCHS